MLFRLSSLTSSLTRAPGQEFNTDDRTDWHAPGRFEDRVEQLFTPLIEQMGGPDSVDLILLHSGMWDLVRSLSALPSRKR